MVGQGLILDDDVDVLSHPRLAVQYGRESAGQMKANAVPFQNLRRLSKRVAKCLNGKHRPASDQSLLWPPGRPRTAAWRLPTSIAPAGIFPVAATICRAEHLSGPCNITRSAQCALWAEGNPCRIGSVAQWLNSSRHLSHFGRTWPDKPRVACYGDDGAGQTARANCRLILDLAVSNYKSVDDWVGLGFGQREGRMPENAENSTLASESSRNRQSDDAVSGCSAIRRWGRPTRAMTKRVAASVDGTEVRWNTNHH